MATNNSANITGAGIVKHNATGGFTPVTPVQYNLLIGGADNSMTSVAPTAASGVPFISQGASSNSVCGTMTVEGGGTGAVSLTGVLKGNATSAVTANAVTQYGVLKAGASNAVSSTLVGTNGQLLVGATAAAPAMATLGTNGDVVTIAGANSLIINGGTTAIGQKYDFFDDFLGDKAGDWVPSVTGGASVVYGGDDPGGHPGNLKLQSNAGHSATQAYIVGGTSVYFGTQIVSATFVVAISMIPTSTNNIVAVIGFAGPGVQEARFIIDGVTNSGNFYPTQRLDAAVTTSNSTVTWPGIYPTYCALRVIYCPAGTYQAQACMRYQMGATIKDLVDIVTPIITITPVNRQMEAQFYMAKGGAGTTNGIIYCDYFAINSILATNR